MNKGSDMPVLVEFLKHRHLLKYYGTIFVLLCRICLYCKTFTPLIDTEAYSELSKTFKMDIF